MQLLGKRWTGLVLSSLMSGPKRFSEIEAALPISARVLSERLKELEAAGLVSREIYPEMPVRVEYALTAKGKAMEPVIAAIGKWAEEWG
jgi:DNA-binding HxlR family transcriptional regulator